MCGIAGLIDPSADPTSLSARVAGMHSRLAHRGPDGAGQWVDASAGCALGHRRLAIIDLSASGAQPMHSACGRFVLVFNGEIYNFRQLRAWLAEQGAKLSTASDSEVLVECWASMGPEKTLSELNGIFAFAIWDRRDRVLTLVRDRLGVKPLYWSLQRGTFRFGSELGAVSADFDESPSPDPSILGVYLRYGCVPAPWCIDPRVRKLEPGCLLTWRAGDEPSIRAYWSMRDVAVRAQASRTTLVGDALIEALWQRVSDAVGRNMVSDVAVGVFLSGGVDSSLVAAAMRTHGPVQSFTIGFDDPVYDESPSAEAIANYLGTEHATIRMSDADVLRLTEGIGAMYDEPFADASQVPTALLCREVRQNAKVVLSGDGGDEGFAGYARYGWMDALSHYWAATPPNLRGAIATMLRCTPARWLDIVASPVLGHRSTHAGQKLRRMAIIGAEKDLRTAYARFLRLSTEHDFLSEPERLPSALTQQAWGSVTGALDQMQLADACFYLPDDVLTKVDRASMAFGLEVRPPLLDHELIEFAFSIPPALRRDRCGGKAPLRALLAKHVPERLFNRPKAGFGAPIAAWLRGPLRDWAAATLERPSVDAVDRRAVRKAWRRHLNGTEDHAPALWALLMLEEWRAAQRRRTT